MNAFDRNSSRYALRASNLFAPLRLCASALTSFGDVRLKVYGIVVTVLLAATLLHARQLAVKDDKFKFSFSDLNGKAVADTDERFKGKVVFVEIWGTWCGTCRETGPRMIELNEKYKDKGLEIVGVAFEKSSKEAARIETIKKYVDEHKIKHTILHGGSVPMAHVKFSTLRDFKYFPTGILIGRDGLVKKLYDGFNAPMMDDIEKQIVQLLDEKK